MTKLYYHDIRRSLSADELSYVSTSRKEKAERFVFKEDKERCLAAGYLLGFYLGLNDDDLVRNEAGKPYAPDAANIFFNISHGGNYVAMAVSEREVGVDIEPVREWEDALARRVFTGEEYKWLKAQGGRDAFYLLWTTKESVLKGIGTGLSLPVEGFSVLPLDASVHEICGRAWTFEWAKQDKHIVCMAVEEKTWR